MKILAIDEDEPALWHLESELKKVFPGDNIYAYASLKDVTAFLAHGETKAEGPDFAFMEISIGGTSGMALAEHIRLLYPGCRFLFCTNSTKYAYKAYQIYAAGYFLKPVSADEIKKALVSLGLVKQENKKVYIRTFGNFELFLNDRKIEFNHSKAKELLAYLVDRRGSGVTTPEAYGILWEDDDYSKDKIQHTRKDLRDTLKHYDIGDILVCNRNSMALDVGRVDCDYYDYLSGSPKARKYYIGEYMTQYSWAENTLGILESRIY